MPRFHIWTIGCQMNKADSARLADGLVRHGFVETARADDADVVFLNTCVVRQSAEGRAVNKIAALRSLKRRRPDVAIAVTGCLVDSNVATLRRQWPHIDLFTTAGATAELLAFAFAFAAPRGAAAAETAVEPSAAPVSAFVTVVEGCDQFCSYCIVPYRRGRERSRTIADVRHEVEGLVRRGAHEVTLLGQNVNAYGRDLLGQPDPSGSSPSGRSLADLLAAVHDIDGLWRIRFLTSHPKDVGDRFVRVAAALAKVCQCYSLPMQAGDDAVLAAMGRGYTVAGYRALVGRLRASGGPDVAISTDVIVGFPGETEAQFGATVALLSELRCDVVHVAAYSPRPGTVAARELTDDVPPEEKQRRRQAIEALQERIATESNAALLGSTVEVLVEDKVRGKWRGRTRSDKLVFFADAVASGDWRGRLAMVEITHTGPWSLQGRVVGEAATP